MIVGRPTFKEFMAGLKRGWTSGLEKVDREEELARVLEDDDRFDELPEEPVGSSTSDDPSSSSEPSSTSMIPSVQDSAKPPSPSQVFAKSEYTSPSIITLHPPLLLVPFLNYIGFKQIPFMIWDFFNQRHRVQSGAKAGYKLVMAVTQPLHKQDPAENSWEISSNDSAGHHLPSSRSELDFDKRVETFYNKSAHSIPEDIEKTRQNYYETLSKKLITARELARGIREPTKDELNNPPPTEVELRAERLKKEQRWRDDVEGWDIVKPSSDVEWDERFVGALCIFVDPPEDSEGAGKSLS